MQANILPSTFSAGEPYVVPFSAPGSLSPISRTVSKLIGPALFATRRREFDSYRTGRPDRFLIACFLAPPWLLGNCLERKRFVLRAEVFNHSS